MKLSMMVSLLIWSNFLSFVKSHVSLTFPPARKYALDFLDTFRTSKPCGMNKGDVKTTIPNGAPLKITWHLGYPHRGSFLFELLDKDQNKVKNLTPGNDFVEADGKTQSYTVDIPSDITCQDCTIRLIRQALEWGKSYRFQSCADIDIVPSSEFVEDCLGNGVASGSSCSCKEPYFGDRCQYKNECVEDSDCGSSSRGQCIDLQGTALPQKQCFCKPGYFGRSCQKTTTFNVKGFNETDYQVVLFGPTTKFYWKVSSNDVLEGVIVAETESYLAIGWRPQDSTKSCHDVFPKDNAKIVGRDFHPMDCLDIVLGTVRNGLSRIGDYYTRDRSTPQLDDEFWGEKDDIFEAIGWEEDGMTFIRFAKSLKSSDGSDHDFKGDLHVAWAFGRNDISFYGQDELKYHGPNKGYARIRNVSSSASTSFVGSLAILFSTIVHFSKFY